MKHRHLLPIFFLTFIAISGCTGRHEAVDLSGIHTSAARETMVSSTVSATAPLTTAAETTQESSSSKDIANVSAVVETYTDAKNGSVSIQYPVVSNLSDASIQDAVNKLLFTNATAIVDAIASETPVTFDITCRVESVDRSRLTAVYKGFYQAEGSAYPTNVFYTNTVDLKQAKSLGFNDYSDAYTMAGYVMSDDVRFYQTGDDETEALLAHRAAMSVEQYTQMFEQADFPLSTDEDAPFPESFSYTHEGVLYFSIPVPHTLGDYAIVTFNMDGK